MSKQVGPGRGNAFSNLKVGDITAGDYTEIEKDGTIVSNGDATTWDELSNPFVGLNLFTVAGRVDFNFVELTLDFNTNARYPEEPVGIVTQLFHSRKAGSDIKPHIHWIQTSNNNANILVEYRWYNSGDPVPASWTKIALVASDNAFVYDSSGAMVQITRITLPEGLGLLKELSSTFEVKIYRDSLNTSALFAGADSYTGLWSAKYYDIHMEKDMNGSREEFVK